LTHRLTVNSLVQLGDKTKGLSLQGKRLAIAVGIIPSLDNLDSNNGVGGTLGMDILMRCSICRFEFQENPRIILLSANK
jgi:hypothetical protein